MIKKLTTNEFIKRARKVHGTFYDYSKVEYQDSKMKVCIIDPDYGEFYQVPTSHLNGHACMTRNGCEKLTTNEFIRRAKKIHGNLYNYSKTKYINYDTNVCIVDPIYGKFWQTPTNHLSGCGNLIRGIKTRAQSNIQRNPVEEFIEKANKIHDNLYDYSKIEYKNCNIKVCIIDPKFGEFYQSPRIHLKGAGNPTRKGNKKLTTKQFVERANEVHNGFYDYSKVKYKNRITTVCIIDPKYGEFYQAPHSHLSGSGCPDRCSFNGKDSIHKDHIIPISILGSRREINKGRPLYKFLNSGINIQETTGIENIRKGDLININGEQIRARYVRNDYNIIASLSKQLLNINIDDIIKEDKNFRKVK